MTIWAILPAKDALSGLASDGVIAAMSRLPKNWRSSTRRSIRRWQLMPTLAFAGNYFWCKPHSELWAKSGISARNRMTKMIARFEMWAQITIIHPQISIRLGSKDSDENWFDWLRDFYRKNNELPDGKYTFRKCCKNIYGAISSEATYKLRF